MNNELLKDTIRKKIATFSLVVALAFSLSACPEVVGDSGDDSLDDSDSDAAGLVVHEGDYGDAPDDRDDPVVSPQALFPTKAKSNGAHHLDTTQSALGYFLSSGALPVSAELDATDPNDPDGLPNIESPAGPDQDAYDDGLLIGVLPAGQLYEFPVVVSVAAGAQDIPRYVNILADWNADLEWRDADPNLPEWVVINKEVSVKPGTSERIFMPEARLGAVTYGIWYRVTLSEEPIDASAFPDGWDGTGEFDEGETEDYIFSTQPLNEAVFDSILYHPDLPDIPGVPPTSPPPADGDDDDDDDDDGECDPGDDDDGDDDDSDGDDDDDGDNPDPDGDGEPGINKKNIGKLRKVGPNTYKLVLCKGKTWQKGFEWETYVRNGTTSNPFVAGMAWSSDPGTVKIRAREVGTSRISFEANTITFPVETTEWVTGVIIVTVIDCDPKCVPEEEEDDDDSGDDDAVDLPEDPNGPFAGIDKINFNDIGKLRHGEGDTYYLVLCCDDEYERGFQYETRVRNAQSSNPGVATLGLQNDPGRIRITPQGEHGVTTITFEANPSTFPYDEDKWFTITIHVMVIMCPEEYYMMME